MHRFTNITFQAETFALRPYSGKTSITIVCLPYLDVGGKGSKAIFGSHLLDDDKQSKPNEQRCPPRGGAMLPVLLASPVVLEELRARQWFCSPRP
jgi:hypothetical protein